MSLGGGRYAVLAELGTGGMGEVYRARDTRLQRDVAIKRIAPGKGGDPAARAHFLQEVKRTCRLNDPHIATVHDVVDEKDEVFLVLELVRGITLRERLAHGLIAPSEVLSIAIQVARALVAAHAKNIAHCDLKPENVMLAGEGNVKVLDFGIARVLPAPALPNDPTRTGTAPSPPEENAGAGTASYMAPETLRGEPADQRSDLFALGIVLYEAWTGVHPFRDPNPVVTTDRILHATPLPASRLRAGTPAGLDALLARLLAKEPGARPQTAREVLGALQEIQRGEVIDDPAKRAQVPTAAIVGFAFAAALLVAGTQPFAKQAIRRWFAPPLPPQKLLAILPFTAVGGDSASQALAAGLSYTMANRLTTASAGLFQVIPLSDVQHAGVTSPAEARRQLGATLVLTGSLQRFGDGARVNFEVVDPARGVQLRARMVERPANSGALLQDVVVDAVVEELDVELRPNPQGQGRIPRGGANSLVLQGRGRLLDYQDPAAVAEAVRLFRRAIAADPGHAPAWAGLGEAAWDSYRLSHQAAWIDTARAALDHAVRLDPALADGHVGLGDVHQGTGFPELAVVEYRRAIALAPTNDAAFRGIAAAYHALGRDQDAESAYREAIARHPEYWGGYSHLGVFYLQQARYAEARAELRKVTELAPLNARGWSNLGAALSYLDRTDEAIVAFREAARLKPSALVEMNLGSLLYYLDRHTEAAAQFRRALAIDPNDYRIHGRLAASLHHLPGSADSSRAHYRLAIDGALAALEVNPRDAVALASLAEYNAALGRAVEAKRRISQALAISADDPEIQFYAVLVYEELGERATALVHLGRAVDAGYSLVEVRRNPDLVELRKDPRTMKLLENRG
jgi:serine/threonine-protein kinase